MRATPIATAKVKFAVRTKFKIDDIPFCVHAEGASLSELIENAEYAVDSPNQPEFINIGCLPDELHAKVCGDIGEEFKKASTG